MNPIVLLPHDEQELRLSKIRTEALNAGLDAIIITDNADKYYITGRIFAGYVYMPLNGHPIYFVRRPVGLEGDGLVYIRKPEEMVESIGLNVPGTLGMEMDVTPFSVIKRLGALFPQSSIANASPVMRSVRAVKTPYEIELIRKSGIKHERVYRQIPHLYQPGMTDLELQVEIERVSRLEGCLGQFRISGDSMEIYMGNVLAGKNADCPTPYDFAMGGEGLDPSLPVGSNGSMIRPGETVMVDMNGNFTGYMTDMSRSFKLGHIKEIAEKAHQCSIDICNRIAKEGTPGVEARTLYDIGARMAAEAGFETMFMGHRQKAGFIGHGVGIEVNELPVIAPRSRDMLREGNVIALEPKFVIPEIGAVGIENTYVVTAEGMKSLTHAPEQLIDLNQ